MEKIEFIKNKAIETLDYIGASAKVDVTDTGENFEVSISGDNLNFLIGFRGESLYGFQMMLQSMYFKNFAEWKHIDLDISGYKKSRSDKLEEMTKNCIDRVRFTQSEVEMPPLSPSERRLVHIFVTGYDDIESESIGEGPDRRIVLKKKD